MKEYVVPVTWSMRKDIKVRAESLEDAVCMVDIICDNGLPDGAKYLDDSFEIDLELAKELNDE